MERLKESERIKENIKSFKEDIEIEKRETLENLENKYENALLAEKYDPFAKEVRAMYESYIRAGFTEEQAWKLTITWVENSTGGIN